MTPALSLYLLAAARAEPLMVRRPRQSQTPTTPLRPPGEIVWIHLGTGEPEESAAILAARIADDRPETGFVVTSDETLPPREHLVPVARPVDFPQAVGAFLSAWQPAAAIWIGGPVWPVLAAKARQVGIPLFLVNATEALAKSHRGIPARDLLGLFDQIEACREVDRKALEKAARRPVQVTGRLQRSGRPLDYDESERYRLATALKSRPVWFAAGATAAEAAALGTAQTFGQSASHRLLLIVQPADDAAAQVYRAAYRSHRSAGNVPPPGASAFVADVPGEDGLWYRLASVSFIGGTLSGPAATMDPFAAALLGSAVLHGPVLPPHSAHFAALGAAGACWPVANAEALGKAVEGLLAPDRTAELAHRAWAVVSEGAEATDHVVEEVGHILDGLR